jgi:16S rRNA (guanine1207-N2)-methyltransferase
MNKGGDGMEHYYSSQPKSKSNPREWRYELRGQSLLFTSDSGVFSKNEVDFGSRLLIDYYEPPIADGALLDVGCGYGPIGLALAKSYPNRDVIMIDINERAIELSKRNAAINRLDNISIFQSDLLSRVEDKKFASVITNPPIRAGKKVVHLLFEQAYNALLSQGDLWIVIQKKQGAPSAVEKLEDIFPEVEIITRKKGYYIIRAKKD